MALNDLEDSPASFLVENIDLLPKGRVLDVAMGDGRNTIYLASLGFRAEGVDISSDAVRKARGSAIAAGAEISARVADLEKDPCIAKEAYDVIICFRYLQRSLIPHIKNGIREGGMLVYETFTIDQTRFGKPANPDFLLRPNELLNLFRDFHCIRYHEGIFENNRAVAGIIAQKMIKGGNDHG
jgi:tellurite methyltransferase